MNDHVDAVLAQWKLQRPDLDASPMAVIGRLSIAARHVDDHLGANFARHHLDSATFDVLATLRRAGAPYALSPKDLSRSAMVTSSAIAQRLNKMEAQGLVIREPHSEDGRGKRVRLTATGLAAIEDILPAHLAAEQELLAPLSAAERTQLATLLGKLTPPELSP